MDLNEAIEYAKRSALAVVDVEVYDDDGDGRPDGCHMRDRNGTSVYWTRGWIWDVNSRRRGPSGGDPKSKITAQQAGEMIANDIIYCIDWKTKELICQAFGGTRAYSTGA